MAGTTKIREILSGRDRRIAARAMRAGLSALTPFYRAIVGIRNGAFNLSVRRPQRVSCPVVSIGNLTTGGTGKTPLVAWLAGQLLDQQIVPGIVSRGYQADESGFNDEYRELKLRLPEVPHLQNSRRIIAATEILQQKVSAIILDDGFQHRQLARDLDIVLIDCLNPFGYGRLIPRGLLREPISALRRADAVVLTRVSQVDSSTIEEIRSRVVPFVPPERISQVEFTGSQLVDSSGQTRSIDAIQQNSAIAFCGIGNPRAFHQTLSGLGWQGKLIEFPDHHHFTTGDVQKILEQAGTSESRQIFCTMKDLVKVSDLWVDQEINLSALMIEPTFVSGKASLVELVLERLA